MAVTPLKMRWPNIYREFIFHCLWCKKNVSNKIVSCCFLIYLPQHWGVASKIYVISQFEIQVLYRSMQKNSRFGKRSNFLNTMFVQRKSLWKYFSWSIMHPENYHHMYIAFYVINSREEKKLMGEKILSSKKMIVQLEIKQRRERGYDDYLS